MQDRHNEIQDVLGQTYALPDDLDEQDLMDELDALEDDLASEAVGSDSVPAYLQVRLASFVWKAMRQPPRLVALRRSAASGVCTAVSSGGCNAIWGLAL